jgi:hypothetical protein
MSFVRSAAGDSEEGGGDAGEEDFFHIRIVIGYLVD